MTESRLDLHDGHGRYLGCVISTATFAHYALTMARKYPDMALGHFRTLSAAADAVTRTHYEPDSVPYSSDAWVVARR